MSIWRKLADAAADLSLKGSIGMLFGRLGGHYDIERSGQADKQVAFTVGMIALGAKMAKADGVITKEEVDAFKEAFTVSGAEMKIAARVFNLAKEDSSGYETCADQLVTTFEGNRQLLEDVLEGLFHIAKADEALHPQEEQFLRQVAKRFGFTDSDFSSIKARHVVATERDPYDVLGITPSVSDAELKSHYQKLMDDNQPNRPIARGVPKEFVAIATEKVATVKEAYDAIAKDRGI